MNFAFELMYKLIHWRKDNSRYPLWRLLGDHSYLLHVPLGRCRVLHPKKYRYNVLKVVMICNDERNVSLQSFVHSQRPGVPGFEDRKM